MCYSPAANSCVGRDRPQARDSPTLVAAVRWIAHDESAKTRLCSQPRVDEITEGTAPAPIGLHPDRDMRKRPVKAALYSSRSRNRSAPSAPPEQCQVDRLCEALARTEASATGGMASQLALGVAARPTHDVRTGLAAKAKVPRHRSGDGTDRAGFDVAPFILHLPSRHFMPEDHVAVRRRAWSPLRQPGLPSPSGSPAAPDEHGRAALGSIIGDARTQSDIPEDDFELGGHRLRRCTSMGGPGSNGRRTGCFDLAPQRLRLPWRRDRGRP